MADEITAAEAGGKAATDDREASLQKDAADTVTRWLRELQAADSHESKWRERATKIVELYKDEKAKSESAEAQATYRFNILFSNTEVLKGALYSQCPAPDVRRRFLDRDPVGRIAALALLRALIASLDHQTDGEDFDSLMKDAVFDMVVPGRAQARVKYVPTVAPKRVPFQLPTVEPVLGEEAAAAPTLPEGVQQDEQGYFTTEDEVVYECVEAEYVEWAMFRMSPAKRWKKVRWVAWGELLTRDDLVKQFGEKIGSEVELKWMPKGMEATEENAIFKRALVWTIWNKTDRKVYVISEGFKEAPLTVKDDPLRLEQFFPVPRPLYSIFTTDSLIPVPEYAVYQDHALQLDEINERIAVLTAAIRRRGVYDASVPELEDLANAGDNKFIGVKDYRAFMEKGGLAKLMEEADISMLAKVLGELMLQAEAKKAQIYEIIGISDIMRGATDARETATAARAKNQWGSIRVQPRQAEVQRFARDLIRLKAEIIAEHFSPQTLASITGISLAFNDAEKQQIATLAPQDPRLKRPTWDQVMQVLRSDKLRGFKIDIETDSTIRARADEEQKNRVDLITAVTGFLEKALPAVTEGMIPKKVAGELMMFGVRAFPAGPQLEEVLDEWIFGGAMGDEQEQGGGQLTALQGENAQLKQGMEQAAQQAEQVKKAGEQLATERQAFEVEKIQAKATGDVDRLRRDFEAKAAEFEQGQANAEIANQVKNLIAEHERNVKSLLEAAVTHAAAEKAASDKVAQERAGDEQRAAGAQASDDKLASAVAAIGEMNAALGQQLGEALKLLAAPKRVVRGPDGRAAGVETVLQQ